jgi:sugar lactone lactonase YvrE
MTTRDISRPTVGRGAAHSGCRSLAALILSLLTATACESRTSAAEESRAGRKANAADGVATGESVSNARFSQVIGGFQGPESVRYDALQDAFFVSNIAGYGSAKDNNGYINRVSAADPTSAIVFVQGGANGITLNAPKGLALSGDTLWVADIDVLRAFDRNTGASLGSIDFTPHGAVMLNDIALAPDGTLRVTDTGILMIPEGVKHTGPDRIFKVGPGRAVSVVASGAELRQPNGITWDSSGKRWIVASFDPFVGEIAAIADGDSVRRVIRRGKGRLDGVEVLPDGSILFTSWIDSSLHMIDASGAEKTVVSKVPEPADIGIDSRRNRVAIPLATLGQVQLWTLGNP